MLLLNVQGVDDFGATGITTYQAITPEQYVNPYGPGLSPFTVVTIETFEKTGAVNLNGSILYDDYTLMRVTWAYDFTFDATYGVFFGIHRIHESGMQGDEIDRIAAAPFADQTGSVANRLKIDIDYVTNTIVTENLIDHTKLDQNKSYRISARVQYDSTPIS
jgi:hypothetical protein